ncbi:MULTISPECIES: HTH domain-containing protein [Haloarcula]|uniref:Uncharacterized protein n=1 Tax=Haloarcula pellucida TaxID=1427151 RepID=A0A830GIE7_9EURY|nr:MULTISPECIES: HTH domain-containing protein [Halomicroarcula]MBX0347506.1 hypothetical protein [Halomicroarcula pellucida]MDS0276620.1 hypothetical protein [Halomicroarcula sp. S1AR25-4]GGN89008.1 hypothetical protein GCM10009030_09310 [Halomicroarcula pellucida]
MQNTECPRTRRAELFVRTELPGPSRKRRTAVETRLQELQCNGVIDGFETTTWAKRIPISGAGDCLERTRYNEFADWARATGACLSPFFGVRTCYSTETGERRKELVLPAMCLAIYEDGELIQVAPFSEDGTPRSIDDCLGELGNAESPAPTGPTTASTAD